MTSSTSTRTSTPASPPQPHSRNNNKIRRRFRLNNKISPLQAIFASILLVLIFSTYVNWRSLHQLEAHKNKNPPLYWAPTSKSYYNPPPKRRWFSPATGMQGQRQRQRQPPKYDWHHPPIYDNNNNNNNNNTSIILHTVMTRFMVGQPNQPILARARYLLFQTFCYPTMYHQTSQNYYWIVLADPKLPEDVLEDLKSLLSTMSNAYLILTSNTTWAADGVGVPNVTSYGVDLSELVMEYVHGRVTIVTGNTSHLRDVVYPLYYSSTSKPSKKSQNIILKMDTLLDADDGLHTNGMEWLQNFAMDYSMKQQLQNAPLSLANSWWTVCATNHLEWHNRDVFQLTPKEYHHLGISSGITGIREKPQFCVSAGFTRVGQMTTGLPHVFPKRAYVNHAGVQQFDECGTVTNSGNIVMSQCWQRAFPNIPLILKTRTITSDSMDHLDPNKEDYRDLAWETRDEHPLLVNASEPGWRLLEQEFFIDRLQAWEASVYLYEHVQEIIQENRASRCVPGFPCRETSKNNLVRLSNHFSKRTRLEKREANAKNRNKTRH